MLVIKFTFWTLFPKIINNLHLVDHCTHTELHSLLATNICPCYSYVVCCELINILILKAILIKKLNCLLVGVHKARSSMYYKWMQLNYFYENSEKKLKVSYFRVKEKVKWQPVRNQITVVAFQSVQLAQASFLQKNQTLQNVFLISVTLRWHRASVACKNHRF